MSESKLDWDYDTQSGEQRATYKGLRIRAVHDDCPENPFEDQDGHWPMLVHFDRTTKTYDEVPGVTLDAPLARFTDHHLVHDQHAIAQALGIGIPELLALAGEAPAAYCHDSALLRELFENDAHALVGGDVLGICAKLYEILGIPCLHTTVNGYSQGDWAELLIVATPEAQKALRSQPADMDDETWATTLAEDMEGQAKLYHAWAFGDVFGYVVERVTMVPPDDFEDDPEYFEEQVEELDSCWGFYGADFAWSGLEEAAMSAADYRTSASSDENASGDLIASDESPSASAAEMRVVYDVIADRRG